MTPPDATTLGAWIVGLGALAVALLGLAKLIRSAWRGFRSVSQFLDDWHGTPARPGKDASPGFPERLAGVEQHTGRICDRMGEVEATVTAIQHELHPNAGASMRDAVDRIEARTQPDQDQ